MAIGSVSDLRKYLDERARKTKKLLDEISTAQLKRAKSFWTLIWKLTDLWDHIQSGYRHEGKQGQELRMLTYTAYLRQLKGRVNEPDAMWGRQVYKRWVSDADRDTILEGCTPEALLLVESKRPVCHRRKIITRLRAHVKRGATLVTEDTVRRWWQGYIDGEALAETPPHTIGEDDPDVCAFKIRKRRSSVLNELEIAERVVELAKKHRALIASLFELYGEDWRTAKSVKAPGDTK